MKQSFQSCNGTSRTGQYLPYRCLSRYQQDVIIYRSKYRPILTNFFHIGQNVQIGPKSFVGKSHCSSLSFAVCHLPFAMRHCIVSLSLARSCCSPFAVCCALHLSLTRSRLQQGYISLSSLSCKVTSPTAGKSHLRSRKSGGSR